MSHNPLIIALDTDSQLKALALVKRLSVTGVAFKVGFELFSAYGPKIVERIVRHHVRVFLDLKYHDIPNTVAKSADVATKMGVWMFNVHASGGSHMMKRAKEASMIAAQKLKIDPPLLVGVTVLTSFDSLTEINVQKNIPEQVLSLAQLAKNSGLDGVVASAQEASLIKQHLGSNFVSVTPGIRLPDSPPDDQKRTVLPGDALKAGSHYLVIGRPVVQSMRPLKVVDGILKSLEK